MDRVKDSLLSTARIPSLKQAWDNEVVISEVAASNIIALDLTGPVRAHAEAAMSMQRIMAALNEGQTLRV